MTSSHTLKRGVSNMYKEQSYGHTQTLSPKAIRSCNASTQAFPDCEATERVFFARTQKDNVGSPSAWLRQAIQEIQGIMGKRLLLRKCGARFTGCSETLHLGTASQAECVRVLMAFQVMQCDLFQFDNNETKVLGAKAQCTPPTSKEAGIRARGVL